MTTILKIPVHAVMENPEKTLDLMPGSRCSRCNAAEAPEFETHRVKYEAGMTANRRITKNFRTSIKINLRLPVCESCYKANFIENPDSCTGDRSPLSRAARARKFGINLGSVFAGAAFILLMKLFPLPEEIPWLKYLWMILVLIAMIIYGITFGLTELLNRKLRNQLKESGYDASLRRAEVFAVKQQEDPEPDDVAVTVALNNDTWARECAHFYRWSRDKIKQEEEAEAK
jgi:hypothetical protein